MPTSSWWPVAVFEALGHLKHTGEEKPLWIVEIRAKRTFSLRRTEENGQSQTLGGSSWPSWDHKREERPRVIFGAAFNGAQNVKDACHN